MRNSLLALAVSLACAQAANAAQPPAPTTQSRIEALEARIKALEANAEAMRQQAAKATAALEATRTEMEGMKAASATAAWPATPPTSSPEDATGPRRGPIRDP